MITLSTIDAKVIAEPMNDFAYRKDSESTVEYLSRLSIFQVTIDQLLIHDGFVFGAAGLIGNGPDKMLNLYCSFTLRTNWLNDPKGSANFYIGPTVARKNLEYNPDNDHGVEWFYHPKSFKVDGHPRLCGMAWLYTVQVDSKLL